MKDPTMHSSLKGRLGKITVKGLRKDASSRDKALRAVVKGKRRSAEEGQERERSGTSSFFK